jgi:poly(3-hydroxybutyrate) depolymerase
MHSRAGLLPVALFAMLAAVSHVWAAETVRVRDFAPNPGKLLMFKYVPDGLPTKSPLVVALHGCTQQAADFDDESGWTTLAEHFRFALLLPEQQQDNNSARCFNFFMDEHNRRGRGEAASIAAMVSTMMAQHDVDRSRVFITGLSAGGAMTAVMLAAYPDVFTAGAIIAGVPYGCASAGGSAFLRTQKFWFVWWYGEAGWAAYRCGIDRTPLPPLAPSTHSPDEWRRLLAEAGAPATTTAWPKVSIWHGSEDGTVHPANLQELVKQWTAAHGIDQVPDAQSPSSGPYRRREYKDMQGDTKVESFEIPGMRHAIPVDPGPGPNQCGKSGDYFAPTGVCAALLVARFWGLDRH